MFDKPIEMKSELKILWLSEYHVFNMALARARAFQEAKAKEEQQKNIEKIFKLTIVKPGDAGTNRTALDFDV